MSCPRSALSDRYKKLLHSEKHTDCSFIVGNSTFKCHKLILSTVSSVFDAMFYGLLKEENPVKITDINEEIFKKLIEFIYTGNIDVKKESFETLMELYFSSNKYLIEDLSEMCLFGIKCDLSWNNILQALDFSLSVNLKDLEDLILSVLVGQCLPNYQFINYTKSHYYHISREAMERIIESAGENYNCLFWFILLWCMNEYDNMNMTPDECKVILKQLNFPEIKNYKERPQPRGENWYSNYQRFTNRVYYKASAPFKVSSSNKQFHTSITSERNLEVHGIVMHSRLKPIQLHYHDDFPDYTECVKVQIFEGVGGPMIYQYISVSRTNYNDEKKLILLDKTIQCKARRSYKINLLWNVNAYEAEYPTCLQSNSVNGINFEDMNGNSGGIIKGLLISNY